MPALKGTTTPASAPWQVPEPPRKTELPPALAPVAGLPPEPVQLRIPIERLMHFRPRTTTGARQITADDHARLMQTQVMLAWLADPATFPCPLRATASASVLEARGTVPDHAAHSHALGLAERYRGRLTVIDSVGVGPVPGYRRSVTEPINASAACRFVGPCSVAFQPTNASRSAW